MKLNEQKEKYIALGRREPHQSSASDNLGVGIVDDIAVGAQEWTPYTFGPGSQSYDVQFWAIENGFRHCLVSMKVKEKKTEREPKKRGPWKGEETRKAAKTVTSRPWGLPFLGREL